MRPSALSLAVSLAAALGGLACRSASGSNGVPPAGEARATRRPVEDVFLITGELRATRSVSLVTPRSEGQLQIRWMAEDGTSCCYSATDNLLDPTWMRLRPEAAIEAVASAGLAFDGTTGTGVVLHMLSGLAIDGRCGLTAIAHTPEEAHRLAQDAQEAIAVEGERAQGSVVGGPA